MAVQDFQTVWYGKPTKTLARKVMTVLYRWITEISIMEEEELVSQMKTGTWELGVNLSWVNVHCELKVTTHQVWWPITTRQEERTFFFLQCDNHICLSLKQETKFRDAIDISSSPSVIFERQKKGPSVCYRMSLAEHIPNPSLIPQPVHSIYFLPINLSRMLTPSGIAIAPFFARDSTKWLRVSFGHIQIHFICPL